jgi:hypothetical protein
MQKEENDGDEALLDENDVTANLVSVAGRGCRENCGGWEDRITKTKSDADAQCTHCEGWTW